MSPNKHNKTPKARAFQMGFWGKPLPRQFGGSLLKGNPKTKRPLSTKEAIHLVLKSERAFGAQSMLHSRHSERIDKLVRKQASTFGVRIYHYVNVGNHIHLVVRIQNSDLFKNFLRATTGLIARLVNKSERGRRHLTKDQGFSRRMRRRFWVARPFTRLIRWGRHFKYVSAYMTKNRMQAKTRFVAWGFDVLNESEIQRLSTA